MEESIDSRVIGLAGMYEYSTRMEIWWMYMSRERVPIDSDGKEQ